LAARERELRLGRWTAKKTFSQTTVSQATKAEIETAHPSLEHFASEPTPHNPATEEFIDREADVVLSFPANGERRRWYPSVR